MKIKLNEKNLEKANELLRVKENNINAAEIYIEYLTEHPNDITSFDIDMLGKKYSKEEAFYRAFLKKLKISPKDEEYVEINNNSHIDSMKLLDPKEYINDSYYKTIGFPKAQEDGWILLPLHYLPYEGFTYDDTKLEGEYYQEITPFGFFEKEFPYLAVIEDEEIWMSIIPHEINTMKKPIEDAYGRVLVLGLGLGYYAFHVANKDDVESVTIIENDKRVINLFNKYILPKFPNKDKINIVYADAFDYLAQGKEYDFVFFDIYHNVADGEGLYLHAKKFEAIYPNTTFSYWIEESILAMLRRQTLTVFEEQAFGEYSEEDYLKAANMNDKIINAIYFATKDYPINNINDLLDLVSDDSLKKLASVIIIK